MYFDDIIVQMFIPGQEQQLTNKSTVRNSFENRLIMAKNLLLFFFFYEIKLNIFEFLTVGQTKQDI